MPRYADGKFACPIFQKDVQLNRDRSCTGLTASTMSDVRRHLDRSHKQTVKLCPTCKEDIVGQGEFESFHGARCRSDPRKQPRGSAADTNWLSLYEKLGQVPVSEDSNGM